MKRNLILTLKEEEVHIEEKYADNNTFPRGRGRRRGKGGEIKFFIYGNFAYKYFECPDRKRDGGGKDQLS
jgi:hypothetical protein